jgi:hypothetical protein
MPTETKTAQTVGGDWDLRGPDFDTALLGAVTGSIIDADRLVRAEWRNGFPNWILYRTVLCGDSLHLPRLRQWAVAFAIAYCMDGGVRREVYSDELACVAAWDALHMLLFPAGGVNGQIQPYRDTAAALGVHHSTYKRLRSHLYASMKGSLDEYWIQLGAAYRHVILYERRNPERGRTS